MPSTADCLVAPRVALCPFIVGSELSAGNKNELGVRHFNDTSSRLLANHVGGICASASRGVRTAVNSYLCSL